MAVFLRYKLRTFRVPEKLVSNPNHFHKLIKGIRKLKTKFRNQNPKFQLPELALASWWRVKAESTGLTRSGARPGVLSGPVTLALASNHSLSELHLS